MFSKKNKKRAFTLIEMLIVIVIIGILAAALIPRLSSARGRANDVARKADLAQTAAALVSYQIDAGKFPTTHWSLSLISGYLISAGMSSIPEDPNSTREFYGINGGQITDGQFGYTPISKWWIAGNGFVIMAGTETEGGSNWVADNSHYVIGTTSYDDFDEIHLCKIFVIWSINNDNNWTCHYEKNQDQLRYIYLY
jgi:type II secretion system protein G